MENFSGVFGELYAARYLRDHGYTLLTANYRTRFGEVDIVARKENVYAFIEVKSRTDGMIALPMESVDVEKQRKLSLSALIYLESEPPDASARFDVIEVYLGNHNEQLSIRHIQNAFDSAYTE